MLLHAFADSQPESLDVSAQQRVLEWLAVFDRAVDRAKGLCRCGPDWLAIRAAHPPTLSTRHKFQSWTITVHNAVNQKLGKPQWVGTANR